MKNNIKILHINCNYLTTALHQTMIRELNQYTENIVFVPTYDRYNRVINLDNNVIVSECFNKWDRIFYFYKQKKIFASVEKNVKNISEFRFIHAYTLFTDGNVAFKLSKKYNIPFVVAIRDTDVNSFLKYKKYLKPLAIKILKNAAAIFFLSASYKKYFFEKFLNNKDKEVINEKIFIIPNGIDNYYFKNIFVDKNAKESIERIKNKKINLIFVGKICKRKNLELTLKAISILRKYDWIINFNVIGKITDQKLYDRLANKYEFNYLGEHNRIEIVSLLRENDIFVMPSKTETFGLVYAEAMSQGLPVIYTKGQGFDGQFDEGLVGYHVDDSNEKLGYKIREARNERIPYMLVAGDKEVEDGTFAVRRRGEGEIGNMDGDEFAEMVVREDADKVIF